MRTRGAFLGLLAAILILAGCIVPTDPPVDPQENGTNPTADPQKDGTDPATDPQKDEIEIVSRPSKNALPPLVDELSYNYALLHFFYSYADDELQPYSSYAGSGDTAPYGDVLAMYADMSDRWTRYWEPSEAGTIVNQLTSSGEERKLIGMTLRVKKLEEEDRPDELYVDRVWVGSPAETAGLLKGDRLVVVNNVDLTVPPHLKGDALLTKYQEAVKGDTVSLTLLRNGNTVEVPPVTKKAMRPPTVYLEYIEDIPLIQITEFSTDSGYDASVPDKQSNTVKELQAALARLKDEHHSAGIIDLRGNPGGSVDQCYAVIEELVAQGIYIRTEAHDIDAKTQTAIVVRTGKQAKPGGLGEDMRWVFLVDANTASAAEIALYAIQNCRPETYVIGETTYGKGVGQYYRRTQQFANGLSGITGIRFFDQDWNTFHGTGIIPDEATKGADALEKAVLRLKSAQSQNRSLPGSPALSDRSAIRALNDQLGERRLPSNSIRGGAWQLLPAGM
jgi:C-terminal peptidase prc